MSTETRLATVDQSGGRLAPVQPPGPGAPPRTPAREPGFDMGVAVRAVRRYWPLIAVLGVAAAVGTAVAVWKFLPPGRQSACTVLHISDVQPVLIQATPEGQVN